NLSKLGSLPPTAQDFLVGGLRIKKVTFRDAANIVLTSNYTYESPKLVDNPQFLFEGNYNVDLTIPGITSFDNVISPEIYELAFEYRFGTFRLFSVGTNPRQIDFMGSHVSYQKVTEKNSEGKNVYHYYPAQTYLENSNFHTTNFYPNIPVFQSSLAGRLMRQETYDANNQLLRESQNVYDIHLVDKDIEALVASTILQEAVVIVPFEFYKVKPEYSVLKNTITTDYFQGTPVQTTTEYFYEGQEHHQPTKIVTVDSKGQQQITENQYPPDVPYKPYMPDLIAQNRIATPIVSKSLQGTSLLSQQEIIFSKSPLTSNFVLPTEAMIAKGLGSLESRVKYEKYDSQGNILQYS
ncbi:MAG: hypothetical protein Q8J97_00225, partial [Flavobacteriaceae bacterium]|nr:hypothetical protein [Flavobacteriaceae bacterium]